MSVRTLLGFSLLLVCAALAACAFPNLKVTTLTANDTGSTVNLKLGGTLEIALEGNPTTGYTWLAVDSGQTQLVQLGEPEFKPDSALLGSGGMVTLRFKAVQAGTAEFQLIYHRSFEPTVPPLRTFKVRVIVGE